MGKTPDRVEVGSNNSFKLNVVSKGKEKLVVG
jgi:hypothetical protein